METSKIFKIETDASQAAPDAMVNEETPLSIDEVIEIVIDGVDDDLPLCLEKTRSFSRGDRLGRRDVWDFFLTPEARHVDEQLQKLIDRWPEEDNTLLPAEWLNLQQGEIVTIAFCAGLRMAGLSKDATRRIMRGFLRKYAE